MVHILDSDTVVYVLQYYTVLEIHKSFILQGTKVLQICIRCTTDYSSIYQLQQQAAYIDNISIALAINYKQNQQTVMVAYNL